MQEKDYQYLKRSQKDCGMSFKLAVVKEVDIKKYKNLMEGVQLNRPEQVWVSVLIVAGLLSDTRTGDF
jgi:hypothetical protein